VADHLKEELVSWLRLERDFDWDGVHLQPKADRESGS
jgi:hypothetical protein